MSTLTALRTRWAAIGAAIAITLGAGGLGIVNATASSGERNIFVPITPCRLMDTRPGSDNVGPRATKLGAGATYTVNAHGNNGDCTGIPTDAVALSLNVTALNASTLSYLAIWPANQPRPTRGSSLNPASGEPPTPNAVTTRLSPTGQFKIYNHDGTVDVIADINGYYLDHNHDDRYAARTQRMVISAAAFQPSSGTITSFEVDNIYGTYSGTPGNVRFTAPLPLPVGTQITSITWYYRDNSSTSDLRMSMYSTSLTSLSQGLFGNNYTHVSSGASPSVRTATLTPAVPSTLTDTLTGSLSVYSTDWQTGLSIKGVAVEYVQP